MPTTVTSYRVFIASPSGLDDERRCFRDTLDAYNEELEGRGVSFAPVGWELTLGGVGRPQQLINAELIQCDYFVLVLWDRWGSPPTSGAAGQFSSGCEEEFALALELLVANSQSCRHDAWANAHCGDSAWPKSVSRDVSLRT